MSWDLACPVFSFSLQLLFGFHPPHPQFKISNSSPLSSHVCWTHNQAGRICLCRCGRLTEPLVRFLDLKREIINNHSSIVSKYVLSLRQKCLIPSSQIVRNCQDSWLSVLCVNDKKKKNKPVDKLYCEWTAVNWTENANIWDSCSN